MVCGVSDSKCLFWIFIQVVVVVDFNNKSSNSRGCFLYPQIAYSLYQIHIARIRSIGPQPGTREWPGAWRPSIYFYNTKHTYIIHIYISSIPFLCAVFPVCLPINLLTVLRSVSVWTLSPHSSSRLLILQELQHGPENVEQHLDT